MIYTRFYSRIIPELGTSVYFRPQEELHCTITMLYSQFPASEQQAALRVYYHEDSGAIEFEACADPGKFLAFDRSGNVIPLNGKSTPIQRMFAVRIVSDKLKLC